MDFAHLLKEHQVTISFSTKLTNNTSTKESSIRVLVNKSTQCKLNLSSSIGTQCFFNVPDSPRVTELRKELRKKQYEIRALRRRNSILSNLNNFSSMIEFKKELNRKTCLINYLRNKNHYTKTARKLFWCFRNVVPPCDNINFKTVLSYIN
ncbi:hypothetical protein Anas_12609 [Armadillidium nasatum]|uniref:Uncharacterized protein n=1 Tax=Armadillidium nasatum TaxID=96803 RepID=A0A5N5T3M5_9CRUS|nr:hypothetical protein Anas_12609 [Armadillidium nasatum]